jgi:hypothetical protein
MIILLLIFLYTKIPHQWLQKFPLEKQNTIRRGDSNLQNKQAAKYKESCKTQGRYKYGQK